MALRRQIGILRRWAWLMAAGLLLGGAVAYLVLGTLPRIYDARATLIVGQSLAAANPDYNQVLASQRLSETYARVATTRPFLDRVIASLDLGVPEADLERRVQADVPKDSTFIVISARDQDPERAAAIANAVASQLIAASPAVPGQQGEVQAFIDAQVTATQRQITETQAEADRLSAVVTRTPEEEQRLQDLQGRLATLRAAYTGLLSFSSSSASNLLTVIEPAVAPVRPVSPNVPLDTMLAALTGLVLAAAIAFGVEYLRTAEPDQASHG